MTDITPAQRTWIAFKRNKAAMAGLAIIVLSVLTALLGYLIMPDGSPNANNMSLPLSLKKPGAKFTLLLLPKPDAVDNTGLFAGIIGGTSSPNQEIPITGYHIKADSLIINEYLSDEDKPERKAYHLKAVTKNQKQFNSVQLIKEHIVTRTYWLGTDIYGRDLLSRIILGTRISLIVGIMAVFISLLVGVTIGALAGYYGGKVDGALSWLMNILWSLPALLLVIALSFALGKGLWQIFIAVGLSMWVEAARLVRGQVISLKQAEYIEAARALGYNNRRIIWRHILPNMAGPVLVVAASNFASAILLEAGLSFLGFGAQPPVPTWGGMIREHYGYIVMDAAYLAIIPGLAIMLMVYAFNLVTTGLRDAFDIKSQNVRL
ncbi:ABC transporter permease [Mucilaginibacter terrae]|uniref:Peptide/nickel transport system permease protein n=1 Tax=Mucilaginibacter terrae TaxID=1955052 RepID=A0ABU3GXE1_9SPHI|nr:ABC transporter permease [Mucilaginibacter terrae]MDT3403340.1 peptide/nickel transport system permease protein [Mucilaginibacter terrae]